MSMSERITGGDAALALFLDELSVKWLLVVCGGENTCCCDFLITMSAVSATESMMIITSQMYYYGYYFIRFITLWIVCVVFMEVCSTYHCVVFMKDHSTYHCVLGTPKLIPGDGPEPSLGVGKFRLFDRDFR